MQNKSANVMFQSSTMESVRIQFEENKMNTSLSEVLIKNQKEFHNKLAKIWIKDSLSISAQISMYLLNF
jgi:beta-lactamase class D